MENQPTNPKSSSSDSIWSFSFRSTPYSAASDSDNDFDNDYAGAASNEKRLLDEFDLSTREEMVHYKPNPFSIAKINAAARGSVRKEVDRDRKTTASPLVPIRLNGRNPKLKTSTQEEPRLQKHRKLPVDRQATLKSAPKKNRLLPGITLGFSKASLASRKPKLSPSLVVTSSADLGVVPGNFLPENLPAAQAELDCERPSALHGSHVNHGEKLLQVTHTMSSVASKASTSVSGVKGDLSAYTTPAPPGIDAHILETPGRRASASACLDPGKKISVDARRIANNNPSSFSSPLQGYKGLVTKESDSPFARYDTLMTMSSPLRVSRSSLFVPSFHPLRNGSFRRRLNLGDTHAGIPESSLEQDPRLNFAAPTRSQSRFTSPFSDAFKNRMRASTRGAFQAQHTTSFIEPRSRSPTTPTTSDTKSFRSLDSSMETRNHKTGYHSAPQQDAISDDVNSESFENPCLGEPASVVLYGNSMLVLPNSGPLPAPTTRPRKRIADLLDSPDQDEKWSTLLPNKKTKHKPTSNRFGSYGKFRLPPLGLRKPADATSVPVKTGMSATSPRRVITWLPPPLKAKGDTGVLNSRTPVKGRMRGTYPSPMRTSSASPPGITKDAQAIESLPQDCSDGECDLLTPPPSDYPHEQESADEEVRLDINVQHIAKVYPQFKAAWRERRKRTERWWEEMKFPSCGRVWCDGETGERVREIGIMILQGDT